MRPIKRKTLLYQSLLMLIILINSFVLLDAQEIRPDVDEERNSLFQSEETLYLTLTIDIKSVFSNREAEERHPAEISYTNTEGNTITIPLEINVRGNFRKDRSNCDFPPLRLCFSDTAVKNTIFHGQGKIKLVTHCRSRQDLYEQNVIKEYLAYKFYNLFAEESYSVRLVHMTYVDTRGDLDTLRKMAFFIEPTKQMAQRNACERLTVSNIHQTKTNQHKTTVMAIFQYMIGNTDWSVWVQHNTILLKEETSVMPIVVPYDFDWSGLVNPPYAVPSEFLPIETVRTRLYRGFCKSDEEVQLALDEFREYKDKIYQVCNSVPFLSEKELKKTLKYIDDFYKIIENPKKVQLEFHVKCRTIE